MGPRLGPLKPTGPMMGRLMGPLKSMGPGVIVPPAPPPLVGPGYCKLPKLSGCFTAFKGVSYDDHLIPRALLQKKEIKISTIDVTNFLPRITKNVEKSH